MVISKKNMVKSYGNNEERDFFYWRGAIYTSTEITILIMFLLKRVSIWAF